MPKISYNQAKGYAQAAGFSGQSLDTVLAIAQAESGLDTTEYHDNPGGRGRDRGIMQINNVSHPEVSDYDAYTPQRAFIWAWSISYRGTNFKPWTTYNSGAYRKFLTSRPGASSASGYVFPVVGWQGSITLHHGTYPGASDLMGTRGMKIVAMRGGMVTYSGSDNTGGNAVQISGDDGLVYYYAHMDQLPMVRTNQQVRAGQQLGIMGDTGNAKGTGVHLHIGIGHHILSGVGPTGGAGEAGFDAVSMLRAAYNNTPDIPGGLSASPGGGCITLYMGHNYTGESIVLCDDTPDLRSVPAKSQAYWNAHVGSIAIPQGTKIRIYENSGKQGRASEWDQSIPDTSQWNNGLGPSSFEYITKGTGGGAISTIPVFGLPLGSAYVRIGYNVNQTLATVPGFEGLCLALDQAESIPGIITVQPDTSGIGGALGGATGAADLGATIRSFFLTITSNVLGIITRFIIFFLGLVLFVGLVWNAVSATTGIDAGEIARAAMVA